MSQQSFAGLGVSKAVARALSARGIETPFPIQQLVIADVLAGRIVEETLPLARARNLRVTAVYGGVGFEKQTREARRSHILVATPGRLEDLLERGAFDLEHIRTLVLDEADRM